MNPETLLIMGALAGIGLCSAPDPGAGGGGGGGGGNPPEPKPVEFTPEQQAKVNAIVAEQRKTIEAKFKPLEEKAGKVDELAAQVAKLTEDLAVAGKSEADKVRIQAEQAAKRIRDEQETAAKKYNEEKARADTAEVRLKSYAVRTALGEALVQAKAHGESIGDALSSFQGALSDIEVEADEKTGLPRVKSVTISGTKETDLKKAAEEFLKTKPWFAAGVAGGTGARTPNGGQPSVKNLMELPPAEAIRLGMQQDPSR